MSEKGDAAASSSVRWLTIKASIIYEKESLASRGISGAVSDLLWSPGSKWFSCKVYSFGLICALRLHECEGPMHSHRRGHGLSVVLSFLDIFWCASMTEMYA